MSNPPVPPRPADLSSIPPPPPLPPFPSDYNRSDAGSYVSPPHFEPPLAAPRANRVDSAIPANMARTLDEQASYQDYRRPSPVPPPPPPPGGGGYGYQPGFVNPSQTPVPMNRGPSPMPTPNGATWSPWGGATSPQPPSTYNGALSPPIPPYPTPRPMTDSLSDAMSGLAFNAPPPSHPPRAASYQGPPPRGPSPPRDTSGNPSMTAPLPTIPALLNALPTVQNPAHNPAQRIAWCHDVLTLVERLQPGSTSNESSVGPYTVADPELLRLTQVAVPMILQIASPTQPVNPLPAPVAEAVYLRATIAASGGFPEHVRHNPRSAFRDFEAAARSGYGQAWFRLGRDYENFNDSAHAKDCFERGVKNGVESCIYRMAMAHLMGQLGLPANANVAIPLLQRAATLASIEVPQPAYVYALLLLDEFSHITVPTTSFASVLPPGSSRENEARKHLERAAYLHFPAAQYKLGHAYEFAQPPFPFDALLSVQYYSLASQQGEDEADMALSKWFLCGAEGSFDKDEALAFTFAEKAARKGLPSAEFAMGYYKEVGVGGPKDIDAAIRWYTVASEHGNTDAVDRLAALRQPSPQALSRQEHDTITENKLVRKRTQAKQRWEQQGAEQPPPLPNAAANGRQVIDVIRKNSLSNNNDYNYKPKQSPRMQQSRLPTMSENPASPPVPEVPGATPRPPAAGRKQYPASHRYTLTDPGSGSASPNSRRDSEYTSSSPSRTQSPASRPGTGAGGRVPSGNAVPPVAAPVQPPKKPGPATFAEMGIQSGKAEDKDCVIM